MNCRDIHSQQEYDEAKASGDHLHIVEGVVVLGASASYDSATVRAYDSATVEAYGSATVEAYGSATVEAYGSATVRAYDSATVRAYDSATVEAYGSATVRAYDSATVRAYDSATVRAYDSATVYALRRSVVTATRYVAVHKQSPDATVTGGTVIEVPQLKGGDPAVWCEYYGIELSTVGTRIVYKAVDAEFRSNTPLPDGEHAVYQPGVTVEAPDWETTPECGQGLHFSPTPRHADSYYFGDIPQRYVACEVRLDEIVTLGDKIKARACRVLHEVDRDGVQVEAPAEVTS